jgi:hypothetical protein
MDGGAVMAAIEKPVTDDAVPTTVVALQRELEKLVALIGDADDAVGNDAVHALYTLNELVAKPLAAAILRPRNRTHRLKAIFLARLVVPRCSLEVQKALCAMTKQKDDHVVASRAALVLSELIEDQMEEQARPRHRIKNRRPTPEIAITSLLARLHDEPARLATPAPEGCDQIADA